MGVLKEQVKCPHCNKKKFKIEYSPVDGIKKLDAVWHPLILQTEDRIWEESWEFGIAIQCKCNRYFFVHHNLNGDSLKVSSTLGDNLSLAVFCRNCKEAFINQSMVCPNCEISY